MAQFIAESIKENGLVLPVNFTEEDFFEAGRCLTKIEQGMKWAIGDWYNSIKGDDKNLACEKVGINYTTAFKCGWVCSRFPISSRAKNLGFKHYESMSIQQLTDVQRSDLLEKARKNEWSVARLRQERDQVLGRPEKVATLEFDDQVESLLSELPQSVSKKAKNEVMKVYGSMKREFVSTVEKEVSKRLQIEREKITHIRKEVEDEKNRFQKINQGLTPIMTQDEFKFIRSLLHPDRHPEDSKKYNKAFSIFNRLLDTVNPNIPIAVLRKRGWAD